MATEKFTVDESMSSGWHLLGEHFWAYIRLASLACLLMFLPDLAGFAIGFNSNFAFMSVVFFLLGIVLKGLVPMGLIYIQLRMIDGHPVSSDDFWKPAGKYFAFVGATLIYMFLVAFGLLLFIVPGIMIGITFQFFPYFIVEHRLGPIQALKASSDITDGAMWELFLLAVLIGVIQSLAGFLFFVGVIPAQVFKLFTLTSVYRTLLNNTPPEKLSFSYKRDTLEPTIDGPKKQSDAIALSGEGGSKSICETLNVGATEKSPEVIQTQLSQGDEPALHLSSEQQERLSSEDSLKTKVESNDSEAHEAMLSIEPSHYQYGVHTETETVEDAKPVDNTPD